MRCLPLPRLKMGNKLALFPSGRLDSICKMWNFDKIAPWAVHTEHHLTTTLVCTGGGLVVIVNHAMKWKMDLTQGECSLRVVKDDVSDEKSPTKNCRNCSRNCHLGTDSGTTGSPEPTLDTPTSRRRVISPPMSSEIMDIEHMKSSTTQCDAWIHHSDASIFQIILSFGFLERLESHQTNGILRKKNYAIKQWQRLPTLQPALPEQFKFKRNLGVLKKTILQESPCPQDADLFCGTSCTDRTRWTRGS